MIVQDWGIVYSCLLLDAIYTRIVFVSNFSLNRVLTISSGRAQVNQEPMMNTP